MALGLRRILGAITAILLVFSLYYHFVQSANSDSTDTIRTKLVVLHNLNEDIDAFRSLLLKWETETERRTDGVLDVILQNCSTRPDIGCSSNMIQAVNDSAIDSVFYSGHGSTNDDLKGVSALTELPVKSSKQHSLREITDASWSLLEKNAELKKVYGTSATVLGIAAYDKNRLWKIDFKDEKLESDVTIKNSEFAEVIKSSLEIWQVGAISNEQLAESMVDVLNRYPTISNITPLSFGDPNSNHFDFGAQSGTLIVNNEKIQSLPQEIRKVLIKDTMNVFRENIDYLDWKSGRVEKHAVTLNVESLDSMSNELGVSYAEKIEELVNSTKTSTNSLLSQSNNWPDSVSSDYNAILTSNF